MKNLKLFLFLPIIFSVNATDYANTKFDNFVSEQGVNTVLSEAQRIVCALSRMGTEDLAGDGAYKATIYMNECEQSALATSSSDSSQATSGLSSATSSTTTASTNSSTNTTEAPDIETVYINSAFTTSSLQSTKAWIVNDKPYDERTNPEPKNILYLLNEQTAPVSDTNKFGDFTLRYQAATMANSPDELPSWYQCPDPNDFNYRYSWCADGADMGRGIMVASGGSIKFKSDLHNSPQQNVVAEYFENGDIAGIYTRSTGFMDHSLEDEACQEVGYQDDGSWDHEAWWDCQPEEYKNSNVSILAIFAFGIEAASRTYCTAMTEVYEVNWQVWDPETQQAQLLPYTLTDTAKQYLGNDESWDTAEQCFSIDKSDAIRNIWDYGVFNSDGSSYATENQSFPIRTFVDVDGITKRVHGYASYWGVHVDEEYIPYITEETEWVRDDWNSNNSSPENQDKYTLKIKSVEVDKREKSFKALNSLDATGFRFWVNDSWWSDEYQKLGFPKVEPWDGKIKFKSSKAVFTDYNNGNSNDPLTYGLYGSHDGKKTYIANLVGAKLDKDNIRKIIKNDSSDPGKPMNLTMEFSEFPQYQYSSNDWEGNDFIRIYLCNEEIIIPSERDVWDWPQLGLTSGQCIRVEGKITVTSDGTELVVSSQPRGGDWGENYYASFYDFDTGIRADFNPDYWNNSGHTYDFRVTLGGIERPAGLELKLQSLFNAFGGLLQKENGGDWQDETGTIQSGLETFLDSSDSFTFFVNHPGINMYDHEGNRFTNIIGSFGVDENPPAAVYVDDIKINEPETGNIETAFAVSLSKAQSSDVTFNYSIAANSTASSDDYSSLSNGTLTIPAGQTTASIPLNVESDDIAEGQTDEKLTLVLSDPVNAVLGRESVDAFIYDIDTNRVIYEDYYGTFDAASSTFIITEGLIYNPNYERLDLPAPITFTTSDWLTHMVKVYNEGTDWEHIDKREMHLYSDELAQNFTVTHSAMENPESATKEAGIVTEQWSRVTLDDLPSSLHCIRSCLDASKIQAHYTDVLTQADPDGNFSYNGSVTTASPSPHADVGPYIKADVEQTIIYDEGTEVEWSQTTQFQKGDHFDGILASDVYTYSISDGAINDANGNTLEIGVDFGVARPSDLIRGAKFKEPNGWEHSTEWGLWSGTLFEEDSLQYIECEYTIDDDGNKEYTEDHPEYTEENGKDDEMRYCEHKIWGNDDILVSYNLNIRVEKQYDIYNADDGSKLALEPPKALFFRAPDDESKFSDAAGKKFRLDYHGNHLGGIPGNVVDIDTGEVIGEYVTEWKDNYRWVSKFIIPDGSILTDSENNEYLVKALRGEEWLGKKDSAVGTISSLLNLKTKDDLLTNVDVDFEISQRKETYFKCILTKTRVETYTDGDGNEWTDEFIETDHDACNAIPWNTEEYWEAWEIEAEFNNCSERLQYDYDRRAAEIDEQKARAQEEGWEYDGPDTPYDDPWFMRDTEFTYSYYNPETGQDEEATMMPDRYGHAGMMERCKTIGNIPTDLINNGNASVVNGNTVYDPTPRD